MKNWNLQFGKFVTSHFYVLKHLSRQKNDGVIKVFMQDSDNIELQTISQTEIVATKSQKIMKLLGKEVSNEISSKITQTEKKPTKNESGVSERESVKPVKTTTSLLNMDPFSDPVVPPQEEDMFSGLDVKDQKGSPQNIEVKVDQKQQDVKNSILESFFSSDSPSVQKPVQSPKPTTSPQVIIGQPTYVQGVPVVYIVNPGPMQSNGPPRRMIQPQRPQGYDFLKEEKKEDSHFDFIKQEIAQNVRK